MTTEMYVIKRDNTPQEISFDKILRRVKNLGHNIEPKLSINYAPLVMKVIDQLHNNIKTTTIDELAAEQCASMTTTHPNYGVLASRIVISNNHKNTDESYFNSVEKLWNFKDINNNNSSLISDELYNVVNQNKQQIEEMIDYNRDYLIDYFGFKTLERAYLMRINNIIIERPQHMWMRVAIGIHGSDLVSVKETYDLMSQKYFTHATPTLYNAGTPKPQLSSCYLIDMEDDSIDGIYNTLKECAQISKWAGGIGLHIHNVRAKGSHIRGTNGTSNGIVPMLRVFNMTARYVDQGGGKRNGSFAIYLEPWHSDIFEFLDLKKNHGDEETRARDLFYGLWIPDLFMECVKQDKDWHLFCPDVCSKLSDTYGEEFNKLYNTYVDEKKYNKKIKARKLWYHILDSQMETGTPYLLYKDAANKKSNQKNIGTIKSSNLCTEIIEYSDKDQTAVCNLASIGLPMFVENDKFDFDKLHSTTKVITRNLNKIIDVNYYPTNKTKVSNLLHRPIGIGVQGLADTFALLNMSFTCEKAKQLNKDIFETIYHASLESSNEIAMKRQINIKNILNKYNIDEIFNSKKTDILDINQDFNNNLVNDKDIQETKPIYAELLTANNNNNQKWIGSYSSFNNSPSQQGILQFDMWGVKPSNRYNWGELKENIKTWGLRNSLLLAPMPTASTSQILGNNECIEPFTSNIYTRRTLAGEFIIVNKHLIKELLEINMWNESIKDNIIKNRGSVQQIIGLPDSIKEKFKIVWELSMKDIIDMSSDRGAFICQSQSLNLWVEDPDYKTLTSMHFYSWNKGLKTGMYYLRRKAKHQPQQFTIEPDDNGCDMCSG